MREARQQAVRAHAWEDVSHLDQELAAAAERQQRLRAVVEDLKPLLAAAVPVAARGAAPLYRTACRSSEGRGAGKLAAAVAKVPAGVLEEIAAAAHTLEILASGQIREGWLTQAGLHVTPPEPVPPPEPEYRHEGEFNTQQAGFDWEEYTRRHGVRLDAWRRQSNGTPK